MTSSATLFYNRRSRTVRTWEDIGDGLHLGSNSPADRRDRRQRNRSGYSRRDRVNPDACDLGAVNHVSSHLPSRQSRQHQERDIDVLEDNRYQSSLGNVGSPGHHISPRGRFAFSNSERLPGAVLLARERLLQRLRSVEISSPRQSNVSPSHDILNNIPLGDDLVNLTPGAGEWLSAISPPTSSNPQETKEKPAGLTVEALHSLPTEIFATPDEGEACSICLECFSEGDQLIRLQCGHRYHFCCLDPWVQTCGDCPYCRQSINLDTPSEQRR